jgi:hypothetical protein
MAASFTTIHRRTSATRTLISILFLTVLLAVVSSCGGGTAVGSTSRTIDRRNGGGNPPENYTYDPQVRMYTDPFTGDQLLIMDGEVIISLKQSALGDPGFSVKWNAFVRETRIRVDGPMMPFGTYFATLPHDMTVEYAVAHWPSEYPDLIEAVEPNGIATIPAPGLL